MHLARKSKSTYDKIGNACECAACGDVTAWFVVYGNKVTVCLSCHEEQRWQHLNALKETTMKSGGLTGSKNAGPKRKGSLSQDNWAASLLETSASKPKPEF